MQMNSVPDEDQKKNIIQRVYGPEYRNRAHAFISIVIGNLCVINGY